MSEQLSHEGGNELSKRDQEFSDLLSRIELDLELDDEAGKEYNLASSITYFAIAESIYRDTSIDQAVRKRAKDILAQLD